MAIRYVREVVCDGCGVDKRKSTHSWWVMLLVAPTPDPMTHYFACRPWDGESKFRNAKEVCSHACATRVFESYLIEMGQALKRWPSKATVAVDEDGNVTRIEQPGNIIIQPPPKPKPGDIIVRRPGAVFIGSRLVEQES